MVRYIINFNQFAIKTYPKIHNIISGLCKKQFFKLPCKQINFKWVLLIILMMIQFAGLIGIPSNLYSATYIGGNISTNTTLTKSDSPYIITNNISMSGSMLTIEPGVEIHFQEGKSLYVSSGTLIAQGTEEEPIIFTADNKNPAPGSWGMIQFYWGNTDETTIMEHCIVEYGGYGSSNGQIEIHSSSPTIRNCQIRYGNGAGIYCSSASPVIEGCTIADNTGNGIDESNYTNSSPTINGNIFSNNGSYPLRLGPYGFRNIGDNTFINNGYQAAFVITKTINYSAIWKDLGIPYVISDNFSIGGVCDQYGCTYGNLTIEPGVKIHFQEGKSLYVSSGTLIAQGTEEEPIIFTADNENPAPGSWGMIQFGQGNTDETTIMEHCIVEYGGYGSSNGQIEIYSSSPTIRNCQIRYGNGAGIYCSSASPVIEGCTIADNTGIGIDEYDYTNSSPTINGNIFSNNGSYPLRLGPYGFRNIGDNTFINNGYQAAFVITKTINYSAIWKDLGIPYVISDNLSISVSCSVTCTYGNLTIEPGVEIHFQEGKSLSVSSGTLIAQGTEEEPIIFTADNENPAPGSWGMIQFYWVNTDETTIMEHCIVEYGGYGLSNGQIVIHSSSPTIRNCQIRYGKGAGIYCSSASPVIEGCTIANNMGVGIDDYFGYSNSSPTINGNIFSNNGSYPLRLGPYGFRNIGDNTFINNGYQAASVITRKINYSALWKDLGIPYVISDNLSIRGFCDQYGCRYGNLTIEPGVKIHFQEGKSLNIDSGTLIAQGTEEEPIIFTADNENPAPGSWGMISFGQGNTDETTIMEHCIVEYGGYGLSNGQIEIYSSSPTIRNCQVRYGKGAGIYCYSASPVIEGCTIANNTGNGIYGSGSSPLIIRNKIYNNFGKGIYFSSSTPILIMLNTLHDNNTEIYFTDTGRMQIIRNNLYGKGSYYIYNDSSNDIDARWNWWGEDVTAEIQSGENPKNISRIYDKFDNNYKGMVTYSEWLSQENETGISSIPGLRIIAQFPKDYQVDFVNKINITFSQPIDPSSFTKADIRLTGPSGDISIMDGPTLVMGSTYQIGFEEQNEVGDYNIYIGPYIFNEQGILMDQDMDGIVGEAFEDRYDGSFKFVRVAGPFTVSHAPSGSVKAHVEHTDLIFHEPIDPLTFNTNDVSITGPTGDIPVISIMPLADMGEKGFRIGFVPQEIDGNYQITIGPDIRNYDGEPMDQDMDEINGEFPDDRYIAMFIIDNVGPRVTSASICCRQNVPVDYFDLNFNEAVDANSLSEKAVTVTGPEGEIEVLRIVPIDPKTTRIHLKIPQMRVEGNFNVSIAPTITTDTAGNLVDQDQDGNKGEMPDDIYIFSFFQEFPDLIITDIWHPIEAKSADKIEFVRTIMNIGKGRASGKCMDAIYLSEDYEPGNDTLIGFLSYDLNIDSNQKHVCSTTVTLPDGISGHRWIIIEANSSQEVFEKGGIGNNRKVADPPLWITLRPHADLQVTEIVIPEALGIGDMAQISWTVQNLGEGDTSSLEWYDTVYLSIDNILSDNDIKIWSFKNLRFLAPYESYTQKEYLPIHTSTPPGLYFILVKADGEDHEEEFTNEDNNVKESNSTVQTTKPQPGRLRVESIEVPEIVTSGSSLIVTFIVKNTGGATVYNFADDAAALSPDPTYDNDDYWLGANLWCPVDYLAPGETYTTTMKLQKRLPKWEGDFYLIIIPDAHLRATTMGELAASSYMGVPISLVNPNPPDLTIQLGNIPTNVASGQILYFREGEKNVTGNVLSGGWYVTAFLSTDQILDENDLEIDKKLTYQNNYNSLVANCQYVCGFNCTYANQCDPNCDIRCLTMNRTLTPIIPRGLEGDYYVIVMIDYEEAIIETDEENNIAVSDDPVAIRIVHSDLTISSSDAPTDANAGTLININFSVTNQGSEVTAVHSSQTTKWFDKVYLSQDEILDAKQDHQLYSFSRLSNLESGGGYTLSRQVILPQQIEGQYYLIFVTDAKDDLYEHEAEHNNTSVLPIQIYDPTPDLMIKSFTAPASGIAQNTINISCEIGNEGEAEAQPNWKVAIYLSRDTNLNSSDILITTYIHPDQLPAGEACTLSQDILLPELPKHEEGDWYLFVVADHENRVYEKGREVNNTSTPHLINITENAPDLYIVSATAPNSATTGGIMEMNWTVGNKGFAGAAGWSDAIYLSKDSLWDANDTLCTIIKHNENLEPGGSINPPGQPVSIPIPETMWGAYYIIVFTDAEHTIYEKGNEQDNIYTISQPITIELLTPDLEVSEINAPPSAQAGSSLRISWSVINNGEKETMETFWQDGIYLSQDQKFDSASDIKLHTMIHNGSLAPQTIYTQNTYITLGHTLGGDYYIYAVTDITDNVFEYQAENNNIAQNPPLIHIDPLDIDLQVASLTAPSTVYQGEQIEMTWQVRNNGQDQILSGWEDTIYLSPTTDPRNGTSLTTFIQQGVLKGNSDISRTLNIIMPQNALGNNYIIIETDSKNKIFESQSEENNTYSSPISIQEAPAPDLRVTAISIPGTAWSGQTMNLSWSVTNQGNTPTNTNTWYDTVYLSRDTYFAPRTDISFGNVKHIGDLNIQGTYYQSLNAKIPHGLSGPYYIIVVTDSGSPDHVEEHSGENNNTSASETTLNISLTPPADLIISNITLPASGIYGESANWGIEVTNTGESPAMGSWYDILYVSEDQEWGLEDKPVGHLLHEGDLAIGQTYANTLVAGIPPVIPGEYYILAKTDILDDVREINDNNNMVISASKFTVTGREMALNQKETGTISKDQSIYYQFSLEEKQDIVVNLKGSAKETAELYIAYERLPSRSDYTVRAKKDPFGNLQATLPNTHPGTYYILIFGTDYDDPPSDFELEVLNPGHSISSLSIDKGGNTGPVTVQISGFNFTTQTLVYLKNKEGVLIATGTLYFLNSSLVSVTFDLSGKPAGDYYIELQNPDGTSCTKDFQIIEGGGGKLDARLLLPKIVRSGRPYTLTLEYENTGLTDIHAPLFVVGAEGDIIMRLFPTEEFHEGPIEVLGISDQSPVGILPPGFLYSIDMEYKLPSALSSGNVFMSIVENLEETIDWGDGNTLQEGLPQEAWEALWSRFTAQIGTTWGDFVIMLRDNANHLGELGERIYDVRELIGFEFSQAFGLAEPVTLGETQDAFCPSPGLELSFTRFFRSLIYYRNRTGPFGRGWTHNYDVTLQERNNGNIVINGSDGLDRRFAFNKGQYESPVGDYSRLTKQQDGTFILTEKEGIVYQFNPEGRVESITDRNGNRITLAHTSGLLTSIAHSTGDLFTLEYTPDGLISKLRDHTGLVTEYFYDDIGEHLIMVTAPGNRNTFYTYKILGDILSKHALTSITYPDATGINYSYDYLGRLKGVQSIDGTDKTENIYGTSGSVMIEDAFGSFTTILYDRYGFPARIEMPSGAAFGLSFDPACGITRITDPSGGEADFNYDAYGNLSTINDFIKNSTAFTYRWDLHLATTVTDPRSNTTYLDYDDKGNLTSMSYADGGLEVYTYNQDGLVTSYTNRRGSRIEYTYNDSGQVTAKDFYSGDALQKTDTYEYDERGNLISAVNEHGTITFIYDELDLLRQVAYPSGRYISYWYDKAGKRARMVDNEGYEINYAYDATGGLSSISDEKGAILASYEYDLNGRLKKKTLGNGVYTTYEYFIDGQLLHLINYNPDDTIISRFDYTYDINGRCDSMTTLEGTYHYTYDDNGQLIGVITPEEGQIEYTYDPAGNRIRVIEDGTEESYTTNTMNQYEAVGNTSCTYDEDGNLESTSGDSAFIYEYDAENQLVSVKSVDNEWRYTYGALGNRMAAEHNDNTVHYLVDPLGLGNVVAEYDNEGNRIASYVHGLGLTSRIDQSGNPAYYTFDKNGNTSEMIDMGLDLLNTYKYTPFGQVIEKTETISNPFQFVGQFGVMQEENGLHYMRARYYDAKLGRFIQPDPIGFAGGDVNLYRYCWNDPVIWIDLDGLLSETTQQQVDNAVTTGISGVSTYLPSKAPPVTVSGNITGSVILGQAQNLATAATALAGGFLAIARKDYNTYMNLGFHHSPKFNNISWELYGDSFEEAMTNLMNNSQKNKNSIPVTTRDSHDPNDKLIALGFGSLYHILNQDTIQYTIRFENDKEAAGSAQLVTITDPLSPELDWGTFELGDMEFSNHRIEVPEGLSYYKTQVDLRPEGNDLLVEIEASFDYLYGIATWTFTAIDPETGQLTEDVFAGFLPPNRENHEGEGFVKFTIKPYANLITGTTINNVATIVFDWNPPMDTPLVFNTIDAGAPSSAVSELPAESQENFLVTWQGQDDEWGSGIAGYDIYVSDNGSDYQLWLQDTTATSAFFQGQVEHTYAFYSAATDNVGHREALPLEADAFTTAIVNTYEMNMPAGWRMISLPVLPVKHTPSALFPDAKVVYRYVRGSGYVRVNQKEDMTPGEGYWILFLEPKTFELSGTSIDSYTLPVINGWYMIGGCTMPALPLVDKGRIRCIYRYVPGTGYERVLSSDGLEPGVGFWILFSDISDEAILSVSPFYK